MVPDRFGSAQQQGGFEHLFLRFSHFNLTLKHDFMTLPTYIQGKYAEAEPLYARAIEIWEKALGPEHPNVATVLNNRAGLLRNCSSAINFII